MIIIQQGGLGFRLDGLTNPLFSLKNQRRLLLTLLSSITNIPNSRYVQKR